MRDLKSEDSPTVADEAAREIDNENLTHATLEELFRAIRSDSAAEVELAWGECYKRYNKRVWSCVFYVIRTIPWLKEPGEVAIDVTSEVFARLPQTLNAYHEVGKPESWLMQVAVRTAIRQKESLTGTWSKKGARRTSVDMSEVAVQEIVGSMEGDDVEERMELMRRLDEWRLDADKARWVDLVKLFLEGYGHDEIAERLGITAATSRTLLWKIRRELGRQRVPEENR
jgi:RNA polymerase sigma factor (sigma-70 family)